jgi:hypothetical protein
VPPLMLSKSRYLNGLQCPKLLWVAINEPGRLPEPDAATQHIFDQGHLVGELAKKLFPGGIDIPADDFMGNIKETMELLCLRKPLFEGGFLAGNLFARADILNPVGETAWDIVEVKSSTSVKDVNIHDVAFQKYCYEQAGLEINRCFLMHINNQYVRNGDIDPKELFALEDITDQVDEIFSELPGRVGEMLKVIALAECPAISIGPHCNNPYACALTECWDGLPEHNIFTLYYGGKKSFQLYNDGILTINDIPLTFALNDKQRIQRDCVISGAPYLDKDAIRQFLAKLEYPLYFLDFETFGTAIPLFNGVRPYQNVPFQFSLHVQERPDGDLKHYEYLADDRKDPRPELLESLGRLLGERGSILAYNKSFEETVLKEAAQVFSESADWIDSAVNRLVDLIVPFRSFHYYHPLQNGSASLKKVLPAITGQGYDEMAIAKGDDASLAYLRITFDDVSPEEAEMVRADLLSYCKMDTEGMVRIVDQLDKLCI